MNRIQWKDFLREIRKNKGRFLSLLFIVALGCAFYSGIRSSEPDMTSSADRYYDETNFCDVRLISTLGLTEEDLAVVSNIEGIVDCEGAYNVELFAQSDDSEPVMNVVSLGNALNQFSIREGRMPESADECFVDVRYMNGQHCKIGDTITLLNTDKEEPDSLTQNTFTIVGYGTWAWYLNLTRGSASIGNGSVDAFMVLLPEVFTQDCYSTIFATVEGAMDVNSYSDIYDDIVEAVTDRIEGIADVQVKLRRDSIVAEGEAELADAKEKIADAKQELADALEKLEDGEDEYADGQKKYEDGVKEYEDGKAEYEDGKKSFEKGKKEYQDGVKKYQDGKTAYDKGAAEFKKGEKALEDGKKQLADAKKKLDDGKAAYNTGKKEYDEGAALIADKEKELTSAEEQINQAESELNEKKQELETTKTGLEQQKKELEAQKEDLEKQRSELQAQKAELEKKKAELVNQKEDLEKQKKELQDQKTVLESQRADLAAQKTSLEAQKKELQSQKSDLESKKKQLQTLINITVDKDKKAEYEAQMAELNQGLAQIDEGIRQIDDGLKELNGGIGQIDDGLSQIDPGIAQIDEGIVQIDEGLSQLNPGLEQLQDGIRQIDDGLSQLQNGLDQINDGIGQIDEGFTQMEAGSKEIASNREQVESGKKELAAGKKTLEESEKQLKDAKKELDEGEKAYKSGVKELKQNEKKVEDARKVLKASKKELDAAAVEIAKGKKKIDDGEKELADAKKKLEDGEAELADAKQTLTDARQELDEGWKEYEEGKAEADEKIADAEVEIADGEKALADLPEGKWYVLNRDTIQTCVEYGMDAERIGKIAAVFPVIFFLVAALVCLTTMTRMVEEERMLIGTMKALGYGKFAIISKYLFYAFSATITGGIFGVLAGSKILPYVIMTAYGMLYTNVPYILMPYHLSYCLVAIGMALLCTVGAAFAACYRELLSTPAALMRPPAPKMGRKIFLERIPAIWSRLNFSLKSTIRNLLRYKKRLIMTVLGIGGCMSILLVSYGLHDSIAAIVDNQYKRIWTYSAYCGIDEKLADEEKYALRDAMMNQSISGEMHGAEESHAMENKIPGDRIAGAILSRNISLDVSTEAATKNSYLYVMEDNGHMGEYLDLHDRVTRESYSLRDDGVILSEKLARMLAVGVGDEIQLKISDTKYEMVTVTATVENYLNNYIYMTPALYEQVFDEDIAYNEIVLRYDHPLPEEEENALAGELLEMEGVTSVHLVRSMQESVDNMMNALNLVVWVLVIAAGLLVFVVTFNLNNINISERRRELASLKVLGFYDMEVAMYVYRENIFLTIFGILAGLFMGTWLHRYLILTLEVEMIMFGRNISNMSYLYSSLLTIFFSVLVNLMMYYKLRQINMVESLKSVE